MLCDTAKYFNSLVCNCCCFAYTRNVRHCLSLTFYCHFTTLPWLFTGLLLPFCCLSAAFPLPLH